MNKVVSLTYELAKRGHLTNLILDVIHDEHTPVQDRAACMRLWYKAAGYGKWNREEVETVLDPIIERRVQAPDQNVMPSPSYPVLYIENRDKKRHN